LLIERSTTADDDIMAGAVTTEGAKVLIVDESAAVRSTLRALLADEGYIVVGDLASGGRLLELVPQFAPDIICLDYSMPGSNGLELLKQVQAAHPALAVVLITSNTDPALEEIAAEAGAAGFIRKPFSADNILMELRQVAHTQRLLASMHQSAGTLTVKAPKARAVIADDSTTTCMLLAVILAKANIEVVGEAHDGEQAVKLVAELQPDLVCLDVGMPVMDGMEALKVIRAASPDIKVLMITGNASRDMIMGATKAGAKGYILKPFHPDKVMDILTKLLGAPS